MIDSNYIFGNQFRSKAKYIIDTVYCEDDQHFFAKYSHKKPSSFKNNTPYFITTDLESDIVFLKLDYLKLLKKHMLASSLFRTSKLQFNLICHHSDLPFDESYVDIVNDPRVLHVYAQNLALSHPKCSPIPIGLEDPRIEKLQYYRCLGSRKTIIKIVY